MEGRNRDADRDLGKQCRKECVGQTDRAVLKHTLPCVKQIVNGKLCITQGAQPVSCDNPEESNEGEGHKAGNSRILNG